MGQELPDFGQSTQDGDFHFPAEFGQVVELEVGIGLLYIIR